jgi:hypothetical protein
MQQLLYQYYAGYRQLIEIHKTFGELVTGFHYTDRSGSVVIRALALHSDSPRFDSKYRHCS